MTLPLACLHPFLFLPQRPNMLFLMKNIEQDRRSRHRLLFTAALIGVALLVIAFISASARPALAAPATPALNAQDQADLDKISAYLQGISDLQGGFLQIGPDGSVADGNFYLRRPGRLRFEYSPPAKLLVVADGTWVGVKDGFSPTQRYPLGSTPLGLLLDKKPNLAEGARILGIEREAGMLRVTLADSSGQAPGKITLVFDQPVLALRQWVVTDAQGLQTTVALRSVQSGIRADNALFVLRDEQRPSFGQKN